MKKKISIILLLMLIFSFCFVITETKADGNNGDGEMEQEMKLYFPIEDSNVKLEKDSIIYKEENMDSSGNIYPKFKVVVMGQELKMDRDYSVSGTNLNAPGKAELIITGKGIYEGKVVKKFTITRDNISTGSHIYFYTKNFKKNGKKIKFKLSKKPKIYICQRKGTSMYKEGKDYKLEYVVKGNKGIAKITGINNLSGSMEIPYCSNTWIKNSNYFSSKGKKAMKKAAKKEMNKFNWKKPVFSKDEGNACKVIVVNTKKFDKKINKVKAKNKWELYHIIGKSYGEVIDMKDGIENDTKKIQEDIKK